MRLNIPAVKLRGDMVAYALEVGISSFRNT
jgi:hypothetical protein